MPSTSYPRPHSDFRTCKWCRVRVIFPLTAEGGKLPSADYGPDPAGALAVQHLPTGEWIGRFLARGEAPMGAENRHAVHECDGTRRHAQRGQWTSAQAAHAAGQRRGRGKRAAPLDTLPGMSRIYPGRTP